MDRLVSCGNKGVPHIYRCLRLKDSPNNNTRRCLGPSIHFHNRHHGRHIRHLHSHGLHHPHRGSCTHSMDGDVGGVAYGGADTVYE